MSIKTPRRGPGRGPGLSLEKLPVSLRPDQIDRVREIARAEQEGNVSRTIRALLDEVFACREQMSAE